MVYPSKKPNLTSEEKVLLHLLSNQRFSEAFEVPETLTQQGIATLTGIERPNVSRTVKRMLLNDLVEERLAHIKGIPRRRKVYFLTRKGLILAKDLDSGLHTLIVKVLQGTKKLGEESLEEVHKKAGSKISILELVGSIDETGKIELEALINAKDERSGATGEVPPQSFKLQVPKIRNCLGREKELAVMEKHLENPKIHFLVVTGLPGVGKTTLAAEFANRQKRGPPVLWYRCRGWDTVGALSRRFGRYLAHSGKTRLSRLIETVTPLPPGEVLEILSEDLPATKGLVVMDDFHLAPSQIREFVSSLHELLQDSKEYRRSLVLVLSRRHIPFYDRSAVRLKGSVIELKLEGLDPQSSAKLLEGLNIYDGENFDKVYSITKGHPLSLELLGLSPGIDSFADLHAFLKEEFFVALEKEERRTLEIASIFSEPIPLEYLIDGREIGVEVIEGLEQRSFLHLTRDGTYEVHDLIREYALEHMSPTSKKKYHKNAAKMYAREDGVAATIEAQHHFLEAGRPKKAFLVLKKDLQRLLHAYELGPRFYLTLQRFKEHDLEPKEWAQLLLLKGKIAMELGDMENAKRSLRELKVRASKLESTDLLLEAEVSLGKLFYLEGDQDEAEANFKKARDRFKEMDSKGGAHLTAGAQMYLNSADLELEKDDLDQAKQDYSKALGLYKRLGDGKGIVLSSLGLGQVLENEGDICSAIDTFDGALDAARRERDSHGIAQASISLGLLHIKNKELDNALHHLKMSLEHTLTSKETWKAAQASISAGQRVYSSGEQRGLVKRIFGIFSTEQRRNLDQLAGIYERIGQIYHQKGDFERALDFYSKAHDALAQFGNERRLARSFNNLGVLYKATGDLKSATTQYLEAKKVLKHVKAPRALAITSFNLGLVYEKSRSREEARGEYMEALRLAKAMGDAALEKALRRRLNNIGK